MVLRFAIFRQKSFFVFFFVLGVFYSSPNNLLAQQDLFNVSAIKITPEGRHYFQEQIIPYPNNIQFDTTYMHGIGNHQEMGLNLYNVFWIPRQNSSSFCFTLDCLSPYPHVSPTLTFAYQKKIQISEDLNIGFGTKSGGAVYPNDRDIKFATYDYFLVAQDLKKVRGIVYFGGYYGNPAFLGANRRKLRGLPEPHKLNYYGILSGFDIALLFHYSLLCDSISGANALGVTVCGLSYEFTKDLALSVGYQIPNHKNADFNPHSILFELNLYF
ncbi:hypothetical protein CH373_02355 [Leptospira perolatii]|uniref:Uncharacterized protein n=1 Tax=Leptospira perolatii TaxID=2023191 RepID=A0A2M9ZS95_9LEPT|nr:hypothetical protein [Leptospira perolatii]PJZ71360.1 hypothetical protein CH360_02355 [Leptospira perolatii]PJZ74894.1 hypothetical protein CH373_02355 [Leptospira perolatii]